MTFEKRCGRLGEHPAHQWTGPTRRHLYTCNGHLITETQLHQWDAIDDAREDENERMVRGL